MPKPLVFGPGIPQVAVFDAAFHHSLPEVAFLYAIPYQFYRRYRVRRYGFHGTSHPCVAHRYRQLTNKSRDATKIITLHLGNGLPRAPSSAETPSTHRWDSRRSRGSSCERAPATLIRRFSILYRPRRG